MQIKLILNRERYRTYEDETEMGGVQKP